MNSRYMKILLSFGLIISLVFGAYEDYEVTYMETPAIDGNNNDWGDLGELEYFYQEYNVQSLNYFVAKATGTKLCFFFSAIDGTNDGLEDYFLITIGASHTWFGRDGSINGPISGDYAKREFSEIFNGWKGEICVPYAEVGLSIGEEYLNIELGMRNHNTDAGYHWPRSTNIGRFHSSLGFAPPGWCLTNSDCSEYEYCSLGKKIVNNRCTPVTEGECGYVSNHQWNAYDCCNNNDCADNEYCMFFVLAGELWIPIYECNELSCESYEEPQNHECVLLEGSCEGDGDCGEGFTCNLDNHLCEEVPIVCAFECCSNSECADDKYCSDNVCIAVPTGECGYVSNHLWYSYECCESSDCEDPALECVENECIAIPEELECSADSDCELNEYCSEHTCIAVPTGECGYVSNHLWYSYECCESSDCEDNEECIAQECVVEEVACTSTGCMPSSWSDCACDEGETGGTKSGSCSDNCGEELEYSEECVCEISSSEPTTEEQNDAEEAVEELEGIIEEAKKKGLDVSKAEDNLEQAKTAYDGGQYKLSLQLASEAKKLVPEEKPDFEKTILFIINGILIVIVLYFIWKKISGGKPLFGHHIEDEKPKEKKEKPTSKKPQEEEPDIEF